MIIKCDVVKDILPLYIDDLCSGATKELVEEHVKNCGGCHGILTMMKTDIKPGVILNEAELKRRRHPFKKIRSRVILLSIFLILFTAGATFVPSLYSELMTEKYYFEISSNLQDIDFEELAMSMASIVNADEGKLYNFMGFNRVDSDRNGEILTFDTSFIVFRNGIPFHFETRLNKNSRLQIRRSWDFEVSKDEEIGRASCWERV